MISLSLLFFKYEKFLSKSGFDIDFDNLSKTKKM